MASYRLPVRDGLGLVFDHTYNSDTTASNPAALRTTTIAHPPTGSEQCHAVFTRRGARARGISHG